MYPLPLPTDWHCASSTISHVSHAPARDWIQSESSLTIRIKELGIAFTLDVLSQAERTLSVQQQRQLNTADSSAVFREVLLKQGGVPLVYAQTIIPKSTLSGTERGLAELGRQPLGQILFQSPQAIRSNIEFAQVTRESVLGQFIEHNLEQSIKHDCYIRRSNFLLNAKPLLVCECFLPALFE